ESTNPSESTGGSGGATGNGGGAGHGGLGSDQAPLEICLEATSEDACAAAVLPRLEDCDDCWHACIWTTIHEVEYAEGSCSYGDAIPACRFVRGGEESTYSLADHCRSFGDTGINAFFQETDAKEIGRASCRERV